MMARPKTLKQSMPSLLRILRFLWPYTRKHRPLVAGSFAALFLSVAFKTLEPWPLKFVFDRVIMPEHAGKTVLPWITSHDPVVLLTLASVALLAVIGLRAVAMYYNKVGFALVGNRVLTDVRGALFRHLHCLSLSFHNKARSGDLIVRVISDIGMLREVAVTAFMPMLASVLILVSMASLMLWLNWQLALVALATLPLYWLPTKRIGGRIRNAARDQRKREGAMASTAAESMGAIKLVQALSLEDTFSKSFSSQNRKSLKEGVLARRLAARLQGTVSLMIGLSTALVLWYGTYLILHDRLSPGDLLVFIAYLKSTFRPMQDFAKYTARLAKASAAGERVLDLFDEVPDVRDRPDAVPAPSFRGAVRFERVGFAYEPGHPVLRGVDLSVAPGRQVALVGPSGNGKSTLVSLLPRLYDPTEGRVCIDGRDVREFTLRSLRAQISLVLQDTVLFAGTIRDNIAYGAPGVTDAEIEEAARLADAHAFIMKLPNGYDTAVGERGVTLSTGQRQRIAVARAAVRRSPILILDEPTSALDEGSERAVVEALERLSKGRTTFLITHNLRHAARSDLILFLENGRISERGSHAELMRRGGRYAALFTLENSTFDSSHTPSDHALTL